MTAAIQPLYLSLGKFTPPLQPTPMIEVHRRAIDAKQEELGASYERITELEKTLGEARLQLEYLHEKFQPTGTTEAVLARIDHVLSIGVV